MLHEVGEGTGRVYAYLAWMTKQDVSSPEVLHSHAEDAIHHEDCITLLIKYSVGSGSTAGKVGRKFWTELGELIDHNEA